MPRRTATTSLLLTIAIAIVSLLAAPTADAASLRTPKIAGSTVVGAKLKVAKHTWHTKYRWYRCDARGKHCAKRGTGRSYKLRAADAGHRIKVRAIRAAAKRTSRASRKVTAGTVAGDGGDIDVEINDAPDDDNGNGHDNGNQDNPGHDPEGPGNSENAPGHDPGGPGNSENAPGHDADGPGNSENAPGHDADGPGKSEDAPGHADDACDQDANGLALGHDNADNPNYDDEADCDDVAGDDDGDEPQPDELIPGNSQACDHANSHATIWFCA